MAMKEETKEIFKRTTKALVDAFGDAPKSDIIAIGLALGSTEEELKAEFPDLYKMSDYDDPFSYEESAEEGGEGAEEFDDTVNEESN